MDSKTQILHQGTMHVPVFRSVGVLEYEDRPIPTIKGDKDVLVEIEACGICGTDLNILTGHHKATENIIIGHEGVGRVKAIGSAITDLELGSRVVIAPRCCCGECEYCRRGLDNQCTQYTTIGTSRDGAFAPYLVLPRSALYTISEQVPLEDAVFFEPLSCVIAAATRVPFIPGCNVAIIGAGPMGNLFGLIYRVMGAGTLFSIDISESRLDFCKDLDIDVRLNPRRDNIPDAIRYFCPIGADLVVDAVGNQMDMAISTLRRGGNAILFGLRSQDTVSISQYEITRKEISLFGSFVGLKPFVQTVSLLESKKIKPSTLITHTLPLEDLPLGLELMKKTEAMKVIITMNKEK